MGSVVYYGFQGHDETRNMFLALCLVMGILGSVLPFMAWFNNPKYRVSAVRLSIGLYEADDIA